MKKFGNCFKRTFYTFRGDSSSTLVHGILTNPSGELIAHAWIEYKDIADLWYVYDVTTDEKWPREAYYIGYKADNIHRYTCAEAVKLVLESGIYGPWDYHSLALGRKIKVPLRGFTKYSKRWRERLLAQHEEKERMRADW